MTKQDVTEQILAKIPEGKTIKRKDIPKLIEIVWDKAQREITGEFKDDLPDFLRDILGCG